MENSAFGFEAELTEGLKLDGRIASAKTMTAVTAEIKRESLVSIFATAAWEPPR